MLVLSRRLDEKILLPTVPVLIKVISSNGGLVRLGFEAPPDVPILREELTRTERTSSSGAMPERLVLRNRLASLTLETNLLRMESSEGDTVVRATLDRIEEELQALRRTLRSSCQETVFDI